MCDEGEGYGGYAALSGDGWAGAGGEDFECYWVDGYRGEEERGGEDGVGCFGWVGGGRCGDDGDLRVCIMRGFGKALVTGRKERWRYP